MLAMLNRSEIIHGKLINISLIIHIAVNVDFQCIETVGLAFISLPDLKNYQSETVNLLGEIWNYYNHLTASFPGQPG